MSERNTTPAFAIGGLSQPSSSPQLEGSAYFASKFGPQKAEEMQAKSEAIKVLPLRSVEVMFPEAGD